MATAQQISIDGQLILNTVTSILPLLSAIPQVGQNAQLIQLSSSAAQSLLQIIAQLPTTGSGSITPAQQAALLSQVYSILGASVLSNPEWKVQP